MADGYPRAKFRFKLEIDGLEAGGFSEVSGFDATIEPIEYREGDMATETPLKVAGCASTAISRSRKASFPDRSCMTGS